MMSLVAACSSGGGDDSDKTTTYYLDSDGDGYGDPAITQSATLQPAGYMSNSTDCDDGSATVNPGATEINDGIDNDCDGQVDEGFVTYYQDSDGDGDGNPAVTQIATSPPAGYVSSNSDCDDNDADVHPDATEITDGIDNNCDGQIDDDLDLASGNYECISMVTSEGTIELALDKINAPNTVNNFVSYTNASFYDGTIFHRVIDGFMIQGGGFDEIFNQKTPNAPIDNEANNGLLNVRGAIAMARTSDPHSATSQFFINTVDNAFLNFTSETVDGWGYAVFGQVVTGIDVVDIISKVSTGATGPLASDVPLENIVIQTVGVIPCSSVTQ